MYFQQLRKRRKPSKWVEARREFLALEKAFTRERDALCRKRRELPWEKVEKEYVFDAPKGKQTLADLFAGKSQLIVIGIVPRFRLQLSTVIHMPRPK